MRLGYGMRPLLIGKSFFHYFLPLLSAIWIRLILRVLFEEKLILTIQFFPRQGSETIHRDSVIYKCIAMIYLLIYRCTCTEYSMDNTQKHMISTLPHTKT